jgi:hypothetical protein
VGTLLALAALSFVLYPLLFGQPFVGAAPPPAPPDASSNPAIDALREIEFDRATGKLSDADYTALKASYTQRAVDAMRDQASPEVRQASVICPNCGPRPESAARFCSRCGAPIPRAARAS